MPKSKRDKKVSLTKVHKKGRALKEKIIEDVRRCVELYSSVYVFTYKLMRNEKMQAVREKWKPSRFFFGKNNVIGIGLGQNKSDELEPDLHRISKCLKGQCGLLFTNNAKEDVHDWFKTYKCEEFARAGFETDISVQLTEGPLDKFPHSLEPYLRQLGLPTKLEKGIVTLTQDHTVCKKGTILTSEQAKLLELLEYKLASFQLFLTASWIRDKGFESYISEQNN